MKSKQKPRTKLLNIRKITIVGVLTAITVVLGQMGWGLINVGLPAKVTIMHIPVIVGAVLEGPLVGIMVGLLFGIFSIIQNIIAPAPLSFALINPLVSVLPRMLIGVTAYYTYFSLKKIPKEPIRIGIAAAVGTITNTIGVLGMIYLLYVAKFAELKGIGTNEAGAVIAGLAITNGLPETIVAIIITIAVVVPIKRLAIKKELIKK